MSWCRRVPGPALGALADAVPGLASVAVYGCPQVEAWVLAGVSNPRLAWVGAVGLTAPPPPKAVAVLAL